MSPCANRADEWTGKRHLNPVERGYHPLYLMRFSYDLLPANREKAVALIRRDVRQRRPGA